MDNRIALVDPTIRKPTLAANESDSETAEFIPRVRLDNSNFFQNPDIGRAGGMFQGAVLDRRRDPKLGSQSRPCSAVAESLHDFTECPTSTPNNKCQT
jgi:hypothetical protein